MMDKQTATAGQAGIVYCLSVDLIGSTQTGLGFSTRKLDTFNLSLVEQVRPHLQSLDLTETLLKFTGDGWLLLTDVLDHVSPLCCLAIIMANKFQDEMSQKTGILREEIPALRISICSGRDILVELPDGRRDWVGDSARRAVRASGYCKPGEIVIDEAVRYVIFRDFEVMPLDTAQRSGTHRPKKTEEDLSLCFLHELKLESVSDSDAPEHFVHTLGVIGKQEAAIAVARRREQELIEKARRIAAGNPVGFQEILRNWNRLVASIHDYPTAQQMLDNGHTVGLAPDVATYNTLIQRAPEYDEAKSWLTKMKKEGVRPDAATFNTLIGRAPEYGQAKSELKNMQREGIEPNTATYNTLLQKAPEFEEANSLISDMRKEGVAPDAGTYTMLMRKAPDLDEDASANLNETRIMRRVPNLEKPEESD